MSKIQQAIDNQRDEREAAVKDDALAELEMREGFPEQEQKEEREAQAFKQGKSRRNLYEELSAQGIEDGKYLVQLVKVTQAKTSAGNPIVRFTYKLAEEYIFGTEELVNVHINTTSTDEWNADYNTNFALQTLGTLYDVLGAVEGTEMDTTSLVADLQSQLEAGLNLKTFETNIRSQKNTRDGRTMVFYTVYPL